MGNGYFLSYFLCLINNQGRTFQHWFYIRAPLHSIQQADILKLPDQILVNSFLVDSKSLEDDKPIYD